MIKQIILVCQPISSIRQCPTDQIWDFDDKKCVHYYSKCEPEKTWTLQTGLNLEDCIGHVGGQCALGFQNLMSAQKYCENHDECAGLKEENCLPSYGIDVECIGKRWRPFSHVLDSFNFDTRCSLLENL